MVRLQWTQLDLPSVHKPKAEEVKVPSDNELEKLCRDPKEEFLELEYKKLAEFLTGAEKYRRTPSQ